MCLKRRAEALAQRGIRPAAIVLTKSLARLLYHHPHHYGTRTTAMVWFNWRRWLGRSTPVRKRNPHRKTAKRLQVEQLESRLAPATFIWSGAGGNSNWSSGANWQGGLAPSGSAATLDNLVFPAGASRL